MLYNIRRWYDEKGTSEELKDCERLEVVKQAIRAIDNAQNFEALVGDPEKEDEL